MIIRDVGLTWITNLKKTLSCPRLAVPLFPERGGGCMIALELTQWPSFFRERGGALRIYTNEMSWYLDSQ